MMRSVDPAVVEFANDAFYLAFNNRDLEEMDRLWATDSPIVCIHPGWQPLIDREEIISSWRNIFANQGEDNIILCHPLRILTQGDLFSVICYEHLAGNWLIATNNFLLESGQIKLVHHQAGQCMEPADLEPQVQTIQ